MKTPMQKRAENKKNAKKLTVKTAFGTFSRSTARPYQFVVICQGLAVEWLEKDYYGSPARIRNEMKEYREVVAGKRASSGHLTVADYKRFLRDLAEQLVEAEACHAEKLAAAKNPATPFEVVGWSGSLKGAQKAAADAVGFKRNIRIIAVATGKEVK